MHLILSNKPNPNYINMLDRELKHLETASDLKSEISLDEWIVMEFGSRWMDLRLNELEELD